MSKPLVDKNGVKFVDKLRAYVWDYYNKTGDIGIIDRLFQDSFKNNMAVARGELAEVYLEIIVNDFVKSHKDIIYSKNVVIPVEGGKTTEIDLVAGSPYSVIVFESKSYNGKKILKDKGTLVNSWTSLDVWGQNSHHVLCFDKVLRSALINKNSVRFNMCLFNYSKGEIVDERNEKYKALFPVIDKTTLTGYLEDCLLNVKKGKDVVWDFERLKQILILLDERREEMFKSHLKRLC